MQNQAIEKKYQVFISSTYEDLKEERSDVYKALLDIGHIPVGMEQFPASNMNSMNYIEKMLSTCDYYILILAGRYGSIDPSDGIGYTEKEYDYAKKQGIPIMIFVYDDIQNLPYSKCEHTKKGSTKLDQFRKKVMNNTLCKKYSSKDQLQYLVVNSMNKCIQDFPRVGWIRADSIEAKALPSDCNGIDVNNLSNYTDSQIEEALHKCDNTARRSICCELISTHKNKQIIEKCISSITNDAEKYRLLEDLACKGFSHSSYFCTIIQSLTNAKYLLDTLQLCIQEKLNDHIEVCFKKINNNVYIYKALPLIYNYDQTLFQQLYDNGNCLTNEIYKQRAKKCLNQTIYNS